MNGEEEWADVRPAEGAVFARGRLAFAAASAAGLAGRFLAFENAGLRVLLTTSPGLEYLNMVTGVDEASIRALPAVLAAYDSAGRQPPTVVTGAVTAPVQNHLQSLGFLPTTQRPLAVMALASDNDGQYDSQAPAQLRVNAIQGYDGRSLFLDVLLAGYGSHPAVSRFLRAEHSDPEVQCFLAWRHDE